MKRTKAAWLARGSAIALMVAGGIALSACSGGDDGLSMAEEEALQEQLEEERKKAAEAERKAREAEEKAAEAERQRQAEEEARKRAERERQAEEQRREQEEERRQAAERDRQRLAEEAAEARKVAEEAGAKAAFNALGGPEDDGARADPGSVSVTPKYRQAADVTTTPAVIFESKRRTSSGRWSITTLSNDGSTHKDDLVVYSDLGGPTPVLLTEHPDHMDDFSAVAETNNIRATLTGTSTLIASSRFPGGGRSTTFEHTIDSDPTMDGSDGDGNLRNDYDTTRFGGTFAGVSGTFECTGTCTIAHRGGNNYELTGGTWTFTAPKTARVPVDDDSHMHFGWWKRERKSDESLSFEMFYGGMHVADMIPDALVGTATYTGPAVGQYAIYQPLGTQTAAGSFTARAELTANFGAADAEGTLSGRITNFSNASNWSVTLKSAAIADGVVTDGDVSWTIAGNTEDGGMWDAMLFSDVDDSAAYPQGVAGTWDAKFDDVGRMIGAFGAHCPTSTCPRN